MENQNKVIFVVQHEYEENGCDYLKHIGVFSSRNGAVAAVNSLKMQPGFRDWPNGFEISETRLNVYGWQNGFGASKRLLRLIGGDDPGNADQA